MSSASIPAGERSRPRSLRDRVHDALVGRRIDRGSSIVLAVLNLAGFAGYGLVFLFYMLGAAMVAGTATPAMERWIYSMLRVLAIGAAACLYTGLMLAAGHRWPKGVQWLPVAMLAAVVLLHVFAPPGINSPRPDARTAAAPSRRHGRAGQTGHRAGRLHPLREA